MPLPPQLDPEQRQAALQKAAAARRQRAELKEKLKAGSISLGELLAQGDTDDAVAKLKVVTVLESLPGVGKVKARRTMEELEIARTVACGASAPTSGARSSPTSNARAHWASCSSSQALPERERAPSPPDSSTGSPGRGCRQHAALGAEQHLQRARRLVVLHAAQRRGLAPGQLRGPLDRGVDEADLVDQLQLLRLLRGEDPAGRRLLQRRVVALQLRPAADDDLLEPLEAFVDQLLQQLVAPRPRSSGDSLRVGLPISLYLWLAIESSVDIPICQQAREVVVRNDHADRAGPGRRLGVDDVLCRRPRPSPCSSRRWRRCCPC